MRLPALFFAAIGSLVAQPQVARADECLSALAPSKVEFIFKDSTHGKLSKRDVRLSEERFAQLTEKAQEFYGAYFKFPEKITLWLEGPGATAEATVQANFITLSGRFEFDVKEPGKPARVVRKNPVYLEGMYLHELGHLVFRAESSRFAPKMLERFNAKSVEWTRAVEQEELRPAELYTKMKHLNERVRLAYEELFCDLFAVAYLDEGAAIFDVLHHVGNYPGYNTQARLRDFTRSQNLLLEDNAQIPHVILREAARVIWDQTFRRGSGRRDPAKALHEIYQAMVAEMDERVQDPALWDLSDQELSERLLKRLKLDR